MFYDEIKELILAQNTDILQKKLPLFIIEPRGKAAKRDSLMINLLSL
jgi:hypothetical protein